MSRLTIALSAALRAAALGLAALAAAAAAPAALRAQAAVPTPPKVFYACYVPNSGTVYRIKEVDIKQECVKSTHVQFSWTDGNPAALSQTFSVTSAVQFVQPNSQERVVQPCPDGSQLLGGGHRIRNVTSPASLVLRSSPDDVGTGWEVILTNPSASSVAFTVWARCAQ